MKIVFNKIVFKNILSYGNKLTEFKFDKGFTALTGRNGQGKSSIIDILSYSLFGQPYRKIKINELINRINNKNLFTETHFTIDLNKYVIQRGLKPNVFRIFKNGEELELLSSKSLIQDELNDIIGIDYSLFKQIIALAVNANKPFLTLSSYEKRNIIETIFNIDVFGDMTKEIKKEIAEIKVNQKIKQSEFNEVNSSYETYIAQRKDIEISIKNFEKTKKNDLKTINLQIENDKNIIKSCKENIKLCTDSLTKIKYEDLENTQTQLDEYRRKTTVIDYKLKNIKAENEYLKNNDYCNQCGHDIDETHRQTHLVENDKKINDLKNQLESLQLKISEYENIIKINNENKKKIDKINSALEKEKNKLEIYEPQLLLKEDRKKEIEDRVMSFDINSFNTIIDSKYSQFQTLKNEVDVLNKNLDNKKIISEILSDSGVKSHFMKKLLPLLNSKINKYLETFELPYIFNFNELLDETIIGISGSSINYYSCSEGEKKRIDLSILLSFIDTIKNISNWDCNLLFFDELLDSAVDTNNLSLILKSIKEMTIKNKLSSYIISHRAYDGGMFDKIIKIEKSGSFSNIIVTDE